LAVAFRNRSASLRDRDNCQIKRSCERQAGRRDRTISLITLRNAQVRRISWVPWGSAGAGAVRVASSYHRFRPAT